MSSNPYLWGWDDGGSRRHNGRGTSESFSYAGDHHGINPAAYSSPDTHGGPHNGRFQGGYSLRPQSWENSAAQNNSFVTTLPANPIGPTWGTPRMDMGALARNNAGHAHTEISPSRHHPTAECGSVSSPVAKWPGGLPAPDVTYHKQTGGGPTSIPHIGTCELHKDSDGDGLQSVTSFVACRQQCSDPKGLMDHVSGYHHIPRGKHDKKGIKCAWQNCGRHLQKGSYWRHISEVHAKQPRTKPDLWKKKLGVEG